MYNYNISVAIVEDHKLVRICFRKLLTSFNRVGKVYEANNGKELINLLKNVPIEVVFLVLKMPVMNEEETCIFLKQNYPSVKILALSMYDDCFRKERMIRLGADGFLGKNTELDELEHAIYAVIDKGLHTNALVDSALNQGKQGPFGLTQREYEIIGLICEEFTMKEISEKLMISEKTVQNHRTSIMTKLSVTNTAGLVRIATLWGLDKSNYRRIPLSQ